MYHLPPVFDHKMSIDAPKCMYAMPKIYNHDLETGQSASTSELKGNLEDATLREMEKRQDDVLRRLEALQAQMQSFGVAQSSGCRVTKSVVVEVSPSAIPLSLLVLVEAMKAQYKVAMLCFKHSSAQHLKVSPAVAQLLNPSVGAELRTDFDFLFHIMLKEVDEPRFLVDGHRQCWIAGEANVCRYLGRVMNPSYDAQLVEGTMIDHWIDWTSRTENRATAVKTLAEKLAKSQWLLGPRRCLADVLLWSKLVTMERRAMPPVVAQWMERCESAPEFGLARRVLAASA